MDQASAQQPEPQTDSSASKSRGFLAWLLWPLILLTLYVLSIGPAVKLLDRHRLSPGAVVAIYRPLIALANSCQPADELLAWYLYAVWHCSPPPRPR